MKITLGVICPRVEAAVVTKEAKVVIMRDQTMKKEKGRLKRLLPSKSC